MDERLLNAVKERATKPCPRCTANKFVYADGQSLLKVSTQPDAPEVGFLPAEVLVAICQGCGYIAAHVPSFLLGR